MKPKYAKMEHFQTLIEISQLKMQIDNALVHQIMISILEEEEWNILKYHAIPYKINIVFFTPILNHDIIV